MVANHNHHVNTIYLTEEEQIRLEQILHDKCTLLDEIDLLRREREDVNREIEELELIEGTKQDHIHRTQNIGRKKFNNDPEKGLQYLMEKKLLPNNNEDAVAEYLLSTDGLSKTAIGIYLGEAHKNFNQRVLQRFVYLQDFHDMTLVDALRKFLGSFRLPGEAQKIDRVMESFAKSYFRQNPETVLPSEDSCYILSFAVIMLNTSLHNPNVKDKPSLDVWIKRNRDIIDGVNLPDSLLQKFYESIKSEAFKLPEDDPVVTSEMSYVMVEPVREGYLFKQNRNKTWARRYFLLVDNCLFYFESPQQKEPRGIIPLEDGVGARLVEDASKHFCFELFAMPSLRTAAAISAIDSDAAGDLVLRACKMTADGKIIPRKHAAYRLCGESYEDRNAWVQCIEACVGAAGNNNTSSSAPGSAAASASNSNTNLASASSLSNLSTQASAATSQLQLKAAAAAASAAASSSSKRSWGSSIGGANNSNKSSKSGAGASSSSSTVGVAPVSSSSSTSRQQQQQQQQTSSGTASNKSTLRATQPKSRR